MVKKKARKSEASIADLENRLKRALADYANLEKRILREKEDFVKLANARLIDKLLAVLDELELCEEHLRDKGLAMVCARFNEVLKSEDVEEIKAQGKNFDPETMDAVELVPGPKNKVIEVVLKGYLLNNKIIRPAKVKVGQGDK
jgi:molecular chaperone GrpE